MWYEIRFHDEDGLLRAEVFGQRPADPDKLKRVSHETWREIARVADERGFDKILILSHARGRYTTLSAYEINSTLASCGVRSGWQIAFVNLDLASYHDVRFSETVAANRGFQIRVFHKEQEARAWLREPETD